MKRPRRRGRYSDCQIVAMFFWMVLHDRTQNWACCRTSYHNLFRPRLLPSPSRFSRRLRSDRCNELLRRVVSAYCKLAEGQWYYLDSRPLTIGACSKDPDGKAGRVYSGFAKGYRLHVIVDNKGAIRSWRVAAMNVAESKMASEMLKEVPANSLVLAVGFMELRRRYRR